MYGHVILWLLLFSSVSSILLNGAYEVLDGIEYVYQFPTSRVQGVVFAAHGCSHSATDWWPRSDSCSKCTGLPVEQAIVIESLKKQMLVIAVSSQNRHHKCWTSGDIATASKVINHLYKAKLDADYTLPLFLLGASSGGYFVGILPKSKTLLPKVSAICVQISGVRDRLNIPVLFVLMRRDDNTITMVKERAEQGYYASHKTLVCEPKAILPDYFFKHGAVRTVGDSETLQRALLDNGFLNHNSLLLKEDPRISGWRHVIAVNVYKHEEFGPPDSLVADASPISEVLNMAWAGHEITDEYLKEVFDWFDASRGLK